MKNIVNKFFRAAKRKLALLTAPVLVAFTPLAATAGIQTLIPAGTTNSVSAASTNTFSGALVANCGTSKDLPISFGFTMSAANTSTNVLIIDTALVTGTNSIFTNGYWQSGAITTNLTIANGTNPVVMNFNIVPTAAGGGQWFYRFSVANTNATAYMTNLFLSVGPKTGL